MISLQVASSGVVTSFPLPLLSEAQTKTIQDWYDNSVTSPITHPFRGLLIETPVKPRIGHIYWPVLGASQFAVAQFVIDSYSLGQLRTILSGADPWTLATSLSVSLFDQPDSPTIDGDTIPVQVNGLYLLDAHPVSRQQDSRSDPFPSVDPMTLTPPSEDDLFVITLVDIRYAWCQTRMSGATTTLTGGSECLGNGIEAAEYFLTLLPYGYNVTGEDSLPAAYGPLSSRWSWPWFNGAPLSYLLDDALACVNMRLVTVPAAGGPGALPIYYICKFKQSYLDSLFSWYDARVADTQSWPGDVPQAQNPSSRLGGGGIVEPVECGRGNMPTVVGPNVFANTTTTPGYFVQVTSGLVLSHITSPEGGPAGITAWTDVPGSISGSNYDATVLQWATDFYGWNQAAVEAVFIGFPPFEQFGAFAPPTPLPPGGAWAFIGAIDWYHSADTAYTRVSAVPQNWIAPIRPCAWVCPNQEPAQAILVQAICNTAGNPVGQQLVSITFPPGTHINSYLTGDASCIPDLVQVPATGYENVDACPVPPVSYNCVSGTGCVAAVGGTYSTLDDCNNACNPPPPTSYNCVMGTGCVMVSGSGGAFPTYLACVNSGCTSPPPPPPPPPCSCPTGSVVNLTLTGSCGFLAGSYTCSYVGGEYVYTGASSPTGTIIIRVQCVSTSGNTQTWTVNGSGPCPSGPYSFLINGSLVGTCSPLDTTGNLTVTSTGSGCCNGDIMIGTITP